MVTSNGILPDSREGQHRDNLRRDGLIPPAGEDRGAAVRIALAIAGVIALAVIGSLPAAHGNRDGSSERFALTGAASQIVAESATSRNRPAP
jgi:hypothetical protein